MGAVVRSIVRPVGSAHRASLLLWFSTTAGSADATGHDYSRHKQRLMPLPRGVGFPCFSAPVIAALAGRSVHEGTWTVIRGPHSAKTVEGGCQP